LEGATTFIGAIYFNYKLRNHQSQRAVLEALARQLYEACQGTATASTMEAMYQLHKKDKSRPSEKELQQALGDGFRQFNICYIVLDALDEYIESYSDQKITSLLKLVLSLNNNVKVLATSRVLDGMPSLFEELGAGREEVVADEKDMRMYVKKRVEAIGYAFKVSEEFLQEIVETVTKNAKGRYVYFMLSTRRTLITGKQVPDGRTTYESASGQTKPSRA
jgi:hypothetical protein